jgi:drug/metabolite transporter (DMT)-like permease
VTRGQADLLLLLVVAVWGVTFVAIKEAVEIWSAHPLTFVAVRFWIATLAFALLWRPKAGPESHRRWPGLLTGLTLLAGYGFQTTGLLHTTPATAGFITGISVVLVPVGVSLLGRRVSPAAWAGVALATAGLGLLSLNLTGGVQVGRGELLVFGCAVSFAAQILLVDRFARQLDPLRFTFDQCLGCALGTSILALAFEYPAAGWPSFDAEVILVAAFCAVFATTLAFLVQTVAQRHTSATHVALIFASEPIFAALASWWLWDERFTPRMLWGCALILAGMLIAELRPARRAVQPDG